MAKKKSKAGQSINARLKNVRILVNSGRTKEAMAYLYVLYTQLAKERFGVTKKVSQTIRDYAIVMVKEMNQNPQTIYPFIQNIEKAIYGGYPATPEFFNEVTQLFGSLYTELTGNRVPNF